MGRIVVGVDGSDPAARALRWAVGEARIRSASVHAVHAWQFPIVAGPMGTFIPPPPEEDMHKEAHRVLDEALDLVDTSGVEVSREVVEQGAARALLGASKDADLLVLGSRGLGGFRGLLLGSVSQQCAQHASCPVVIVPHEDRPAHEDES